MELQKENTQMEDILQLWHKPEVMEVDIVETLASYGTGNDGGTKTSAE